MAVLAREHALRGKDLSAREREVLGYVADGRTADFIATRLRISPDTVRTHIRRILIKLGARDRANAVALAYDRRILPDTPDTTAERDRDSG